MNRRALIAGAAALAASSGVPAAITASASSATAVEFVRLLANSSPDQKLAFAADLRAWPNPPTAIRLMADVIERWGQREAAGMAS